MIGPMVRFEVARRLRWRPMALSIGLHPPAVAAAYAARPADLPGFGDDVAWLGVQAMWLVLLSFQVGRDRGLGLEGLLTPGLIGPGAYLAGKALGLGVVLVAYHGALLAVALALSPDRGTSVAALGEVVSMLFPLLALVLLAELVTTTRIPMAYVTVAAAGGLAVAFGAGLDAASVERWAGADGPADLWRPALLGGAGLGLVWPLALRRVAGRRASGFGPRSPRP